MTKYADRLAALRVQMKGAGVRGFLVPRADEFQGEYVPARAERLSWISGFTGSAGMVVVMENAALAVTDSRYDIQIRDQVDAALFDRRVTNADGMIEWILANAGRGDVIGYDPRLHTPVQIAGLEAGLKAKGITMAPVGRNLLDAAWTDQPGMPMNKVEVFPEAIAGRSVQDKRESIAAAIKDSGAVAAVITQPDSVAWMLNIRGTDVPHTPFALSNMIVHANGDVDWFIDAAKITPEVRQHIGNRVQIKDPSGIQASLEGFRGQPVQFDPKNSAIWFRQVLEGAGATIVDAENPCILPKACKTMQEQAAIRNAHLRDGVNVTKFLVWLDDTAKTGSLTEQDVVDKLDEFRRLDKGYRDTSFDTISGWAAHGAIVHYRVSPESNAAITPPGILLLDSGAQYIEGTTDITRTIAVGEPTEEMKTAFTLVLKGHIAIASVLFPEGTRGVDLDVLARKALWSAGMNYGHGTGHGVGCYLSVHEEGGALHARALRPFKPGMVVSNEPGFYKEGAFGIRIENLILVRQAGSMGDGSALLGFETLTCVPIDRRLVRVDLLNTEEIKWLDEYHARVRRDLGPHLDQKENAWLKEATAPIKKRNATAPVVAPWPFKAPAGP